MSAKEYLSVLADESLATISVVEKKLLQHLSYSKVEIDLTQLPVWLYGARYAAKKISATLQCVGWKIAAC